MMATYKDLGTESFELVREHQSFRLPRKLIETIEDIAKGVEEGEAGLKSCGIAEADVQNGVSRSNALSMFRTAATVEDEDECFNLIGDLLVQGFSFEEIAKRVQLDGGATHLLSPERWCQLVGLVCKAPGEWQSSFLHERRLRTRRAMTDMRRSQAGRNHAAILHIVYGWPDPFLQTLPPDARVAMGHEFGPLARYTDIVETKRMAMVRAEAFAGSGDVVNLARHRDRLAWADRCISSGDALRAALRPPRSMTPDETKEQYQENVAAPYQRSREALITQIRIQANRMLTEASKVFVDAWNRN